MSRLRKIITDVVSRGRLAPLRDPYCSRPCSLTARHIGFPVTDRP